MIKIIIEGVSRDDAKMWFSKEVTQSPRGDIIVEVPSSDASQLLERLRSFGPRNMYRAWAFGCREMPIMVPGARFTSLNNELEQAVGRHLHLGALPDEL